eukprot:CAMPEP_0115875062 /NCGR_PEP_ID=MMETSP0287-20121206/24888_1 /TAXON_ID=412157 /ORGANISM="Chrysochromulina rotalis, Strain UIO044" /LENGTH=31 /DNA_ID= /DNA_START= /DNA_END= /DNA_ORIENTATION=
MASDWDWQFDSRPLGIPARAHASLEAPMAMY